ncbi:oxidoreductase [Campylobacter mucosalis]|uniref:Gfo/Idh/MocA family protein n=1 Tax=Campylobacter mucosalis TaxID=202 RepID=UPI0004D74A01|nr:Gfo/Idh/MocA family oxidoreductase [Campylobacter mucosalis]KEA45833.1 oxidoreductase [Campylobacter mucosalis]QKF62360.1 glucosamine-6-P synthase, isomerase subunit PtmF [Campylobacter mucosalis]
MKALIIGFGSIGKRHFEVLISLKKFDRIDVVSSQELSDIKTFKTLKETPLDEYDYFVIATPTALHYEQLKFIDECVNDKIIFCEKPLFEKLYDFIPKNQIFIGYVLRFHPFILKIKELTKDVKILSVNAKCSQYLPTWRMGDYTKCYSAKKELGGGVLLDLSHEIDYISWICGKFKEIKSINLKISDLKINSDDIAMIMAKTNDAIISLQMDYISKITNRQIFLDTDDFSIFADLVNSKLIIADKSCEKNQIDMNFERNDMFKAMHNDILNEQKIACSFKEALMVMKTIKTIQEQNNG